VYAKLFESLTDSTVWALPHHVRVVWVTIMAKADRTGYLAMSVYMLARASNVTLSECEEALALFMAPDPHSRTKDHEGRRLIPGPDGWQVVNYVKYRNMRSEEERREYRAEWMRNHRQQQKREQPVTPVNSVNGNEHITEPEAEAEPKAKKKKHEPYADPLFQEFWEPYPNKAAKTAAWVAWQKLSVADRKLAAAKSREYGQIWLLAPADRRQFIPHPATWLNAGRMHDDPTRWRVDAGGAPAPVKAPTRLPEVGKGEWNPDEAQQAAIRRARGEE